MSAHPTPTCWAISDGAAGNERQALALAQALGLTPRVIRLRLHQPWAALAPRLLAGAAWALRDADDAALAPPWPALAIGCGRRAALATRALRRWSAGRCWCVQILDPRIDSAAFDLVIAPAHDRLAGGNVIASIGALNPVDADWLAAGRNRFAALGTLPGPRTAVLVGGSTRAQRLDQTYFDALLERLQAQHASHGGSFMFSVSRRTPTAVAHWLRQRRATLPGMFWSGPADGDNPYAGLLGWADRIVVTPDSVNMISEACATGRPVHTFAPRPLGGKLAAFHAALRASGHLRELGDPAPPVLPPPLAETREIGAIVRERWLREHPA
ncbi:MAG: mitochondrial fission ELM1 family protein [Dokdonella sp.]|uniref:mitochondrial fission ELM1 family protein n=1 Tax=Dokdonella sp. TaxID=2291710 RepID=UPI0025B7EC4B|nr:mitochondrial fission ELM1 family protein [Dokdonella sp.]MBX3701397.1 mitochondrial fission ELM1 family protein [Dokdonella sp.]